MLRIFLLDDKRTAEEAMKAAGLQVNLDYAEVVIVREPTHAVMTIHQEKEFDYWVIDHDLGERKGFKMPSGYDFLKAMLKKSNDKVPRYDVFSCSSNPVGREDIHTYWKNFKKHVLNRNEAE